MDNHCNNRCHPSKLPVHQVTAYRHLTRTLVRETLAYANTTWHQGAESKADVKMNLNEWKKVHSRDNLTLFKERKPPTLITGTSFDSREHQRLVDEQWQGPKLLVGVGSLSGSLDDIMYGIMASDRESMRLESVFVHQSRTDSTILAHLEGPTRADPYHFLGIKWMMKTAPKLVRSLLSARDFVFLEATGTITRSTGVRYGYHVRHSVDFRGPRPARAVLRGKLSCCTIFQETPTRQDVRVYIRGYVEPRGHVPDTLALKFASPAFLSASHALERGQAKKLQWFVNHPHLVTWTSERAAVSPAPTARCGGTCGRTLKKKTPRHRLAQCLLCHVWLCAKCQVTTKLEVETCHGALERRTSRFCRACVGRVRQWPATELSRRPSSPRRPSSSSHPPVSPEDTQLTASHAYISDHDEATTAPSRPPLGLTSFQDYHVHCFRATKPHGSRRHWKQRRSQRSRPLLVDTEHTPRGTKCSVCGPLSQCSTLAETVSTTSPLYPFATSWRDSQTGGDEVLDRDKWPIRLS
ncbi:hypothetical protein PsorP6_010664 [Peronosclerospora sorghi]|uniref:Uncharacterized protein n=2 Tax=Peronosclerospora sorghi TaxID=230839 RepID=A0ACC0VTS9_9STRA|nr:hypothetical protein PsorP6_010668 [Peronosclerospora sorghi]KAI9911053.1 hypothetical protein PsorP6_010664 [Peronosclerospora sorghi]